MRIISFDTTNLTPSIALYCNGKIIAKTNAVAQKRPAEFLVPLIEEILRENEIFYDDLDAVAICKGPASFTSVRIALSVAKMIALAAQKKVLVFDSLLAIAALHRNFDGEILVAMDASSDEFFVAKFACKNGILQEIAPSQLVDESWFARRDLDGVLLCGSAKEKIRDLVKSEAIFDDVKDDESAEALIFLAREALKNGEAEKYALSDANYLRDPSISVRKK